MANYNTFVAVDCRSRKPFLVTSSARMARDAFGKGIRCEVWNENRRIEVIRYTDLRREKNPFAPYIAQEKEYIAQRQARATARNKMRH